MNVPSWYRTCGRRSRRSARSYGCSWEGSACLSSCSQARCKGHTIGSPPRPAGLGWACCRAGCPCVLALVDPIDLGAAMMLHAPPSGSILATKEPGSPLTSRSTRAAGGGEVSNWQNTRVCQQGRRAMGWGREPRRRAGQGSMLPCAHDRGAQRPHAPAAHAVPALCRELSTPWRCRHRLACRSAASPAPAHLPQPHHHVVHPQPEAQQHVPAARHDPYLRRRAAGRRAGRRSLGLLSRLGMLGTARQGLLARRS